ncbi:MAG: anti-sigma factor family protein [Gemmatimonadaceae bacterium]
MTDCPYPEIRDSLPDLLHGRLGEVDKATLTAHVESCAACRAELALLREIRASAPLAPRIDIERVTAALPVRSVLVRDAPRKPAVSGVNSPIWKFAAAIAIAISGGLLVQDRGVVSEVGSRTVVVSPIPAEAEDGIVRVEPAPATETEGSLSLVAGLHELTDDQIESLLTELDAIETIPSAEPEQGILYLEEQS